MNSGALITSCTKAGKLNKQKYARFNLNGARILLAEDNDLNQLLINDLLSGTGIVLEVVNNGREAVDILQQQKFDAVLMDINMPVMDGYEASQVIRQQLKLIDLPVIAMTAELAENCKEKLLAAGMNDYIPKPFKSIDFFSTLSKWISFEAPEMSVKQLIKHSIKPINGIDIESGLQVCQGKEEFYLKLLRRFTELHLTFVSDFQAALDNDDFSTMGRLAHTLKGVAGNIGAKQIEKSASALNDACDAKVDLKQINHFLDVVEINLDQVLESLAGYFVEENPVENNFNVIIEPQRLAPLMVELYRLLNDSDTDAKIPLSEIKEQLNNTMYQESLSDVIQLTESYLFKEASTSLSVLAGKLNIDLVE